MRREIVASGSTMTVAELLELLGGVDRRARIYLPGFGTPRPILSAYATDLEVTLETTVAEILDDVDLGLSMGAEPLEPGPVTPAGSRS